MKYFKCVRSSSRVANGQISQADFWLLALKVKDYSEGQSRPVQGLLINAASAKLGSAWIPPQPSILHTRLSAGQKIL